MKNILKFAFHFIFVGIQIIYVVLAKLAPLHSYVLWFHPREFVVYTTSFSQFVAGNTGTAFGLLMLIVSIVLFAKLSKLQKKVGDADKPKPQTRSERHQRSVK